MDIKKTTIFVLLVVIFSFLYIIVEGDITGNVANENIKISVNSLSCVWKDDSFEACSTILWEAPAGYYAKGYIGGGEPVSQSPKLANSPAIYCQNVGDSEGKRAAHAYLYGSGGALKAMTNNNIVECKREELPTSKSKKKFTFMARGEFQKRPRGEGTFDIRGFGGMPVSCKFKGKWVTDNAFIEEATRICNKATGTFEGFYGHGEQYVITDHHPFTWQGISGLFTDPAPKMYSGYIAYMNTCDRINYNEGRYYARARVSNIYDDGLALTWEYFDDGFNPRVHFQGEAECDIAQEQLPTTKEIEVIEPVVEPEISEIIEEEVVGVPIAEEKQSAFWQRVKSFFGSIFKK